MNKNSNDQKKTKPKVSIVVPIYNVEKYLNECVDSILAQTLKEIEVILVDDGSPDNCGKIIDEYAKKDPRVVAVHQKNSGYSVAVNNGINMAKGEYVGIIESDDWIEPDMYERLYESAKENDTDITKSYFWIYNSKAPIEKRDIVFANPSGVDMRFAPDGAFKVSEWPKFVGCHASIWSAIYRSDFVKKIKVPETTGASYQDFPFMIETACKARRISVVRKPFVHWRNDPNQGNSTSANGKKLLLMTVNTKKSLEIIKENGLYDDLKEAFFAHAAWANLPFFYRINHKYKKEYWNAMKEIFADLATDKTFTYLYFRPEDKKAVEQILKRGYSYAQFIHYLKAAKRRLSLLASHIFPSYKRLTYIKTISDEIYTQNQVLSREIELLRAEISNKRK